MAEDSTRKIDQYMVDRGPEIVASSLSPQLGSSDKYTRRGEWDMRILSVIEEKDLPFFLYAKIRSRRSRTWATIYEEVLNLKISIGGRGRRDIIRMEGVSKGGMPSVESEIPKPNFFARNIWNRNWKQKAEAEGLI